MRTTKGMLRSAYCFHFATCLLSIVPVLLERQQNIPPAAGYSLLGWGDLKALSEGDGQTARCRCRRQKIVATVSCKTLEAEIAAAA